MRHAISILLVMSIVLLSACAGMGGPASTPVAWRCTERLTFDAVTDDSMARLDIPGNPLSLPRTKSASGARYAEGDSEFWIKGQQATLDMNGRAYQCEFDAIIETARDAGVDFRGIGQEPGWVLDVSEGDRFVLQYNFGRDKVEMPWSDADVLEDGTRIHLIESAETEFMKIVIEPMLCEDSMSGQRFNYRVKVAWKKLDLRGCGRDL